VNGSFRRFDRQPIHHLHRRRNDAVGDNRRHGAPGFVDRLEPGE
jgi:hypothetical protein